MINKKTDGHFITRFIITIVCIAIIALLLISPSKYIKAVYNGLIVWALNVLPSSFPFYFLTKLLTELGILTVLAKKLEKIFQKVYNAPGIAGYIFVMNVISGYPTGAVLIKDLYEKNYISSAEAARISTFTSTAGPLFILGSLASLMLNRYDLGLILLASHILGSLLNGLLYRNYKRPKNKKNDPQLKQEPKNSNPFTSPVQSADEIIKSTINDSVLTILIVGGYISLFFMLITMLESTKILYPIQLLINKGLSFLNLPDSFGEGISYALIEITNGCLSISNNVNLNPTAVTVALGGALSFGGLCIGIQSFTFLSKAKVSLGFYLLSKLTQSLITMAVCFLVCLIVL